MRVIITAGGTGGHIFPALALINKIKEYSNNEILYIGTHNRMEKEIIPNFKIPYKELEVISLKRKISFINIKAFKLFLNAIKKSKKIIKEFKPDVVVGFGGYVSAPVLYAAKSLNIPTFIHEQNSIPGLSNKFLGKFATKIGVSFPSSQKYFKNDKVIITGNPRSEEALKTKGIKKEKLGLKSDKKLVLISLGSLGSASINKELLKGMKSFNNKNYEVIYITGKNYYDDIIKNNTFPSNVKVFPFLDNMLDVMKISDLFISRAGASAISEIIALKLPTIFIPSPYVTNNHQYKNALELVNQNASLIIEEKNFNSKILIDKIDLLFNNPIKLEALKKGFNNITFKENSLSLIYDILINIKRGN